MLFDDRKTNHVFFSVLFSQRWPELFKFIKSALTACSVDVEIILGNMNIWTRDWMPLQVGDHFVKFRYKGYGTGYDDYPWLNIPKKVIEEALPGCRFLHATLVLDGGNVVRCGDKTVITEKVFIDNADRKEKKIISMLEYYFNTDIIILPIEPDDDLGHSDGIVKFVDEKTILLNDYNKMKTREWIEYGKKIESILGKAGLSVILMPYAYGRCGHNTDDVFKKQCPLADDNNPAVGYYINFLLTNKCILLPVFGFDEDKVALGVIRACYPEHVVIPVDCYSLAMEGGLMNCVTANYIKENEYVR